MKFRIKKAGTRIKYCVWAAAITIVLIQTAPVLAQIDTPNPSSATSQTEQTYPFNISAKPLPQAIADLSAVTGLQVLYTEQSTFNHTAPALKGNYSVREALRRLLDGSGLAARFTGSNSVTIELAPFESGAVTLPVMTVTADAVPGKLPPVYAGGQVARGSRVGLLGNRDYMDTPFSITSYTEQAIRDQQATSIAELLATTDPSVRAAVGSANRYDALTIRGFRIDNDELALNGLYGLIPAFRMGSDPVERIELIKGPNALLNGITPWGSVGGGINIVTKRADDTPLTRVTAEYMSSAWFGGHADIGRRFGEDGAFGVRVNGAFRSGDTEIDRMTRRNGSASLGLDYQGNRLRLSADIIYQSDLYHRAARGSSVVAGVAVPKAPDPKINIAQPFDYSDSRSLTGLARGEFDITPDVTLFAAIGGNHFAYDKREAPSYTILDTTGNATGVSNFQEGRTHSLSTEAGARARFATGSIDHQLVVTGSILDQTNWFGQMAYARYATNIYNPRFLTEPGTPTSIRTESRDSDNLLRSVAIADTLSVQDGLVQLTVGVRRQQVRIANYTAAGAVSARYDESATTPSFALVVRPTQQLSFYANYIEALTAGASAPPEAANPNQVFAPYKSKQYEVGSKLDLGAFGATLGLFQISVPSGLLNPVTGIYSLDGEQRHRGIEFNAFGELGKSMRVVGGALLLDAKLRRTQGGINDGNHALGAPAFQANVGVEWDTPFIPGFTLSGRVIRTSKAYTKPDDIQHVPGWTRFDLGGRYTTRFGDTPVILRANVTNLFDKSYWTANPGGFLTSDVARTFWLSLSADF